MNKYVSTNCGNGLIEYNMNYGRLPMVDLGGCETMDVSDMQGYVEYLWYFKQKNDNIFANKQVFLLKVMVYTTYLSVKK